MAGKAVQTWQCPSIRAASPAAWLLRVQTADFFATASDAQQPVLRPGVAGKRELGGLFSASLAVNSRITSALSSDLSSMRVGLRCSIGSAKREATCQAAQAAQEHPQVGHDLSAAHRSDRRLARGATQVALLSAAVPAPSPCPHPGLTPGQNTAYSCSCMMFKQPQCWLGRKEQLDSDLSRESKAEQKWELQQARCRWHRQRALTAARGCRGRPRSARSGAPPQGGPSAARQCSCAGRPCSQPCRSLQ